jgi:TonB family protein
VESQIEVNFRLLDKKDADAAAMAAVQPVAQTGALPAPPPSRLPAGLGAPVLIRKVEPEYTEEARAAKFQGTVTLTAVISAEGVPQDMRVVHSLGMGLDEKAIEAVKKWQFRPGTNDGNPVAMMSTIEVNFRLGAR